MVLLLWSFLNQLFVLKLFLVHICVLFVTGKKIKPLYFLVSSRVAVFKVNSSKVRYHAD